MIDLGWLSEVGLQTEFTFTMRARAFDFLIFKETNKYSHKTNTKLQSVL